MGILSGDHNSLVATFGILGNIVSICVYLAPLPTFRQIYRKKSTLGYQSLPYVVALFSATLWMYYAFLTTNATLLISINSVGCLIETVYIIMFLKYATAEARRSAIKQLLSLNVCFFGFIFLLTQFEFQGEPRVKIVGWVCVAIAVGVFAAPLSIVFQVVRTRSVEFMPLPLSFFLTLSAVMWFGYGFFKHDWNVALPNVIGFVLGLLQMLLYAVYRNNPKIVFEEEKLPEHIINMVMLGGPEVHPVAPKDYEAHNKINNTPIKEKDEKDIEEEVCTVEQSVDQPPMEPTRAMVNLGPSPPMLVVCAA